MIKNSASGNARVGMQVGNDNQVSGNAKVGAQVGGRKGSTIHGGFKDECPVCNAEKKAGKA